MCFTRYQWIPGMRKSRGFLEQDVQTYRTQLNQDKLKQHLMDIC